MSREQGVVREQAIAKREQANDYASMMMNKVSCGCTSCGLLKKLGLAFPSLIDQEKRFFNRAEELESLFRFLVEHDLWIIAAVRGLPVPEPRGEELRTGLGEGTQEHLRQGLNDRGRSWE